MPTIVGITLRNSASAVPFDPADVELSLDDVVVVTTERGTELGRVSKAPHERKACELPDVANKLVRKADAEDLEKAAEFHAREKAAMPIYRRLVAKHKLDMKPTDVEFLYDGERAVFCFVAEDRIDFRELVRDLAAEFHVRIDMRQIGVRDEARKVGGLGHCGEQLCCVRFGGEFQPVSIRMAKEQDLPLNPLKISGLCGRLMCCLRYEYDAYKDFKGRAPKKGAIVDVGGTMAKVVELDTPRERITMRKEDGTRVTFGLDEMECKCNGTCPCSVKADAIARSVASSGIDLSSIVQPRERKLTESSGRREPVQAPSATDAPQATPSTSEEKTGTSRRRRRRGGSGGGSKAEGQAPTAEKSAGGRSGGRQPKAAAKQAPAQAPAPSAEGAPKRRRRRRRGGGGGAAGEGAPSAGE
ncbi:MAG TPA: regulatory iron-sulfur-containing complex subunit RicT [Coriobacteriia bacterium]